MEPSTTSLPTNVGAWTLKNPDGDTPNFTYDVLKNHYKGRQHSAHRLIQVKLRCDSEVSLDSAGRIRDLFDHRLILPRQAADIMAGPQALWSAVDARASSEEEPILAGPTIWFPQISSQHWAVRQATEFAQAELADVLNVAVQLVAHAPHRIDKQADFHVHLQCSARVITSDGLGPLVRELFIDGCQLNLKAKWDAWWGKNALR